MEKYTGSNMVTIISVVHCAKNRGWGRGVVFCGLGDNERGGVVWVVRWRSV